MFKVLGLIALVIGAVIVYGAGHINTHFNKSYETLSDEDVYKSILKIKVAGFAVVLAGVLIVIVSA